MWKVIAFVSLFLTFNCAKCNPINHSDSVKNEKKCGYSSCVPIKEGYVNVHLVPHSHDDVGWVKTVDQFYYGTKSDVYTAGVQFIYDSVLKSVQKRPDRKFIYVETAFFWKWWQEQEERERNILKELVNNGQIEFIGGGWSMNDEAVTNYQSIVDQMTWGLRKLNDCFGECGRPKIGWQIDPFGHSSEMASIFAQLGYDGVILGRIDFEDQKIRLANKSMEMVWRGSNSLGSPTDIFTSVLYNHYDAPTGFCFDLLCGDYPLVDDISSPEYNIESRSWEFIQRHIKPMLKSFQSSNVLIPMGRDFAYQNAEIWYNSMDKLIKYINNKEEINGTKYNIMYSTPSCYAAAVHQETQGVLTSKLKTDDFFPYASEISGYWTGYYTSRPTLKRFERMGNNFLQICKQLYALANISSVEEPKLDSLREAMGVMQHHDAVTGTEKENVAYDYSRILYNAFEDCGEITNKAIQKLANVNNAEFSSCLLTNISQCSISEESDKFVVTVYNPLSRSVNKVVRLPVLGTSYVVTGPDGGIVTSDIFPISSGVQKIIGRTSEAALELVFIAKNVPPVGYKTFYIQKIINSTRIVKEDLRLKFTFFKGVRFDIDPSTGLIENCEINGVKLNLNQSFWFYNGTNTLSTYNVRPSGAYIFRPEVNYTINKVSDTATFEIYRGKVATEVHQRFNECVSQIIRIYEEEKYLEFDWVIGPVEMKGIHGKEIITRYSTDLESEKTFYTDSNGREYLKRIRNFRPTWNINVTEKESSNYYPITSKISIRDEKRNVGFTVLTDRAEGGSSLKDGDIELMVHRNTLADDRLGVGEALIELAYSRPIVVRGSHYVVAGKITGTSESEETIAALEHKIADEKLLDSWVFISIPKEKSFEEYQKEHNMEFSGLQNSLPDNVHIMTLEPWKESSYLLRLEHTFEKNEDPTLSLPVEVNLKDLFTTFDIISLEETTLGANQLLSENDRLKFSSTDQPETSQKPVSDDDLDNLIVTMNPMQIRTFIVSIQAKI